MLREFCVTHYTAAINRGAHGSYVALCMPPSPEHSLADAVRTAAFPDFSRRGLAEHHCSLYMHRIM